MNKFANHIIFKDESLRIALTKLDVLAADAILFVVDHDLKLIGSLTDGDLRRGFIRNYGFDDPILLFAHKSPIFIKKNEYTLAQLEEFKERDIKIIPILDSDGVIIDILNFRYQHTIIPADAVLMAGGEGKRLRPLTEHVPKPLLKVGGKPIIEYNIDKLLKVGVKNINLSVNYLGDQIIGYFGSGEDKNANISYVREDRPLGTIASILLVENYEHEDIIIMNSDLLTDIDFVDFFKTYKESNADMAVAATSYHVDIPYAVMEVDGDNQVFSLKEKPRYTYFSNAGIYIIKKELLKMIPENQFYDVTDLMDTILANKMKLITYPIIGYWLDIGKHDDFNKAQEDIKHLKF